MLEIFNGVPSMWCLLAHSPCDIAQYDSVLFAALEVREVRQDLLHTAHGLRSHGGGAVI